MLPTTGSLHSSNKIFRTLFDEHRVLWDILRHHSYFVAKQAVKQFIPPQSFVARNYVSNEENCKIRMSRLHIMPWLTLFVTPDNAVLYSENDPIVPTENAKWTVRQIDNSRLDIIDGYDEQGQQKDDDLPRYIDASINFIPSRDIAIPSDNRTLNFNPNAPTDIQLNATGFIPSDTICNPQLELEIGLSNREDFRQGNIDSDINRFERIDFNQADHQTAHHLLLTTLQHNDRLYSPNYGRLDDSWNKYLAAIDEVDTLQDEEESDQQPEAKRIRNDPSGNDFYPIPQQSEPSTSSPHIE